MVSWRILKVTLPPLRAGLIPSLSIASVRFCHLNYFVLLALPGGYLYLTLTLGICSCLAVCICICVAVHICELFVKCRRVLCPEVAFLMQFT